MTQSVFTKKYEAFRLLLIQYRQNQSITQTQLAQMLGRPQSFVSKYEIGERRLDVIEFLEIVHALNSDPYEFIKRLEGENETVNVLREWDITAEQLTDLLNENPSLRGMLLGHIAELKLKEKITAFLEVTFTTKFDDHDRKKKGDLYIIYKHRAFDLETKSLQTDSIKWDEENSRWTGEAQVDASDRRTIALPDGAQLETTLLLRGEFDILAVNCYAFSKEWNFAFARNRDLPCSSYRGYSQTQREHLIASLISVTWPPEPPFYEDLRLLLDEMIDEGCGSDPLKL